MAGIFSFKCSCCKAIHEGSPSFSFAAPIYYDQIAETDRAQKAKLTSDLCVIENEDFFVRVCLEIAIRGVSEPFLWGVWATLSQKSFDRYVETYNAPVESDSYFGWFSNKLPYYPDTLNLKTTVRP